MLTKWFGNRSSRSPQRERSFRPWLESLEPRNAPGGFGGGDGNSQGGDHGHGPPHQPPGPPGPPPPVHPPGIPLGVDNSISVAAGNGNHGSFNNSTITGSFNTTVNNTTTVSVNLTMGQTTAVAGLLGISNFLSSALSNPQLGSLLSDEVAAAVDQYLITLSSLPSSPISSSLGSALKTDLGTLQTAITSLETSPGLTFLGTAVHDITLDALMAAQSTI
jgi:hypothetical protein